MQIEVKGRNDVVVSDELREHVEKRFAKIAKQVSELATLEVELRRSATPRSPRTRSPRRTSSSRA